MKLYSGVTLLTLLYVSHRERSKAERILLEMKEENISQNIVCGDLVYTEIGIILW